MKVECIAEFTGSYGSITIPEKLIQRVWKEQRFEVSRLKTSDHLPIQVLHPGEWNMKEGPDFLGAHLVIGEETLWGDIEVHFHERDWWNHRHDGDPRYKNVILHVLLFPCKREHPSPPTYAHTPRHQLILLPLLNEDMETLSEADYVETFIRPLHDFQAPENWLTCSPQERRQDLKFASGVRFYRLVHRIRKQVESYGWEESCHQVALEILGIPHNREAFRRLSLQYPLADFRTLPFKTLEAFLHVHCRTRGMRPANQPGIQLKHYHQLTQKEPLWTKRVAQITLPMNPEEVNPWQPRGIHTFRKSTKMRALNTDLQAFSGWNEIGEGKWNTLMVNLFLPLLAMEEPEEIWPWWFAWYSGNHPDFFRSWLKSWEILQPMEFLNCNGWDQGLKELLRNLQT